MIDKPLRYLARGCIELTTPLLIGGDSGEFTDRLFVADANGLPTIPGTSLCGVLRSAMGSILSENSLHQLFGYQTDQQGQGSRLVVSFGCMHDQNNRPVEGRLAPAELRKDPVLLQARQGVFRDHVRIGHHGAVDGEGKFDQTAVAAGHRFSFELELAGKQNDEEVWLQLLNLLVSGSLRLGGSTRRGFGGFKINNLRQKIFDLKCKHDFQTYCQHPVSLSEQDHPTHLKELKHSDRQKAEHLQVDITLMPEGFWMFGGGDFDGDGQFQADMLPVSEARILWGEKGGKVGSEEILIPGSSIKGALAHRCAFYARALEEKYADELGPEEIDVLGNEKPAAVVELFGEAKDDQAGQSGKAGIVFIDDIYIDPGRLTQKHIDHVSLDRFTGGPIDGALYSEKPFYKGPAVSLKINIQKGTSVSGQARRALKLALDDLIRGELPLGAGVNRGNGVFVADEVTSIDDEWFAGGTV